jgi:Excalibur calcium-binding domain
MRKAPRAGSLTLVRLSRLLIAGILAAGGVASVAAAADHQAASSARHFKVSGCDYHDDQGCPAVAAPDSCHAKAGAQDRHCTPGVLNPAVTQATIKRTICRTGWTSTIRPPTSYTDPLKLKELRAYGEGGRSPSGFELDHLISLELGGAPSDPRNLWPESHKNSYRKDGLENSLRAKVCAGSIGLAKAQWRIVHWPKFASHGGQGGSGGGGSTGGGGGTVDKNCSDFSTQAEAQAWFVGHGGSASNDVAGLDTDHDGVACESLP